MTPAVPADQVVPVVPAAGLAATGRAATIVGVGMMMMNALAYAFTLLAAHVLGPTSFGAVGALLGVMIVANVGSLTLQATAARRLATSTPDELPVVRRDVLQSGRTLSVVLGLLLLAAVPLLDTLLQLDDWVATAMVAVACSALTMMGGYAGIVQGERRWGSLAAIYLTMGVGRFLAGGVALVIDASTRSAMIGVAVGSLLSLGGRLATLPGGRGDRDDRSLYGEVWRNGHRLLAFFAFTNLDVLLARHLFSHHEAGIYAGGAIITKACLFLTTFVLVVAFPSMAADRGRRAWLRPMAIVLALGGCAVIGALLLPGLAEAFAGGRAYVGLGSIAWVFALEGTMFAALQILVYDSIAGQSHSAAVVWVGVVVLAAVASFLVHSVEGLAAVASVTAGSVALVLCLWPGLRGASLARRNPATAPTRAGESR